MTARHLDNEHLVRSASLSRRLGQHPTLVLIVCAVLLAFAVGCAPAPLSVAPSDSTGAAAPQTNLRVVAVESFLSDIAQNVAGDRVVIDTLIPLGTDPHSFEPTPQDLKKVADSNVLIINGAGLEVFVARLLENAGGDRTIITASQGLAPRAIKQGEPGQKNEQHEDDPHFWLNPLNVIQYAENIRDGLTAIDPAGAPIYKTNAETYVKKLTALDADIQAQTDTIPTANRKLVTDHDTLGYYADRYGFEIVGMLVPGSSAANSPSAQQLAELVDRVRDSGARAIFLESSTDPRLAEQVAQDTGVQIVTELYTHSLSGPDGPAPTYIQMLKYDTDLIAQALQ